MACKTVRDIIAKRIIELTLEQLESGAYRNITVGTCSLLEDNLRTMLTPKYVILRDMFHHFDMIRVAAYDTTYEEHYSGNYHYPIKGYGVEFHGLSVDRLDYTPAMLREATTYYRAQHCYMELNYLYRGIDGQLRRQFLKAMLATLK